MATLAHIDFLAPNSLITFLGCIVVAAAVYDLRFQKIPNLLTYPTMILSLFYHGMVKGPGGVLFSLEGLGAGMGLLILFYMVGGMGGGDVKLLGAVGSVLGPLGALKAFIFTALAGGLYAMILIIAHYRQCRAFITRCALMTKTFIVTGLFVRIPAPEGEKLPKLFYGIAIACGTLLPLGWQSAFYHFPFEFSL